MLSIIALSSFWGAKIQSLYASGSKVNKNRTANDDQDSLVRIVRVMSVIQAVLGLMTLVNAHVQIITRLASGYPIWYVQHLIFLSNWSSNSPLLISIFVFVSGRSKTDLLVQRYWWIASRITGTRDGKTSEWLVRWMVMYAMIQGALFASFLPPAWLVVGTTWSCSPGLASSNTLCDYPVDLDYGDQEWDYMF